MTISNRISGSFSLIRQAIGIMIKNPVTMQGFFAHFLLAFLAFFVGKGAINIPLYLFYLFTPFLHTFVAFTDLLTTQATALFVAEEKEITYKKIISLSYKKMSELNFWLYATLTWMLGLLNVLHPSPLIIGPITIIIGFFIFFLLPIIVFEDRSFLSAIIKSAQLFFRFFIKIAIVSVLLCLINLPIMLVSSELINSILFAVTFLFLVHWTAVLYLQNKKTEQQF